MAPEHIKAIKHVQVELQRYIDANRTGSGGLGAWPAINPGHPLHSAVIELETFYPANSSGRHTLPDEGWMKWVELLHQSRATGITTALADYDAKYAVSSYPTGVAAVAFQLWIHRQLEPVADGLFGQQLRIGGQAFDLSRIEAAIVQALIDGGGPVELHTLWMKVWKEPYQNSKRGRLDTRLNALNCKLFKTPWTFRVSGKVLIREIL